MDKRNCNLNCNLQHKDGVDLQRYLGITVYVIGEASQFWQLAFNSHLTSQFLGPRIYIVKIVDGGNPS